jgi:hypothetical protein
MAKKSKKKGEFIVLRLDSENDSASEQVLCEIKQGETVEEVWIDVWEADRDTFLLFEEKEAKRKAYYFSTKQGGEISSKFVFYYDRLVKAK